MVMRFAVVGGRALIVALACAFVFACKPNIEGRLSLVDQSRVLAIQSAPAEQAPGDEAGVDYHALYATVDDVDESGSLQWALCTERKALTVIGPASLACYAPSGKALDQLGKGADAHAVIDMDDCSVFGPSPPTMMKKGEPPPRAADPDTTGGYYQPVRVLVPVPHDQPDYVVGVTRLNCGLSGATPDQAVQFSDQYRPNENPAIDEILVTHKGGRQDEFTVGEDAPKVTVSPHERITLRATWATCPQTSTCGDGICGAGEYAMDRMVMGKQIKGCPDDCMMPKGCTGSEPYVQLDPVSRTIVNRHEGMTVAWFATDGSFDDDGTGRTEREAQKNAFSENEWVAPGAKGRVHFWFVLRDDRGGVGWTELFVDVGS